MLKTSTILQVISELHTDYKMKKLTKEKVRKYFKDKLINLGEYLYWMETFEDENNNEEMPTLD